MIVGVFIDAPKITCDDVEAAVGEYEVRLRCYVDARPSPMSLFWLTEPNVTLSAVTTASDPHAAVPVAAAAEQYSTLVRVRFFCSY